MENYEDNDLSKLAPRLASLKKSEPFQAPVGYFDSLPGRIHEQVRSPEPAGFSMQKFFRRLLSREGAIGLAFSLVLAACVYVVTQAPDSCESVECLFAELSSEELMSAVDEHSLSDQELYSIVGEQTLNQLENTSDFSVETYESEGGFEDMKTESGELDMSDLDTDDLLEYYY